MRTGDGERTGFVEEVEPPRRLVFWWTLDEEPATRVEIELEPAPDGTCVRVSETRPLAVLDLLGRELDERLGGDGAAQMRARHVSLAA